MYSNVSCCDNQFGWNLVEPNNVNRSENLNRLHANHFNLSFFFSHLKSVAVIKDFIFFFARCHWVGKNNEFN